MSEPIHEETIPLSELEESEKDEILEKIQKEIEKQQKKLSKSGKLLREEEESEEELEITRKKIKSIKPPGIDSDIETPPSIMDRIMLILLILVIVISFFVGLGFIIGPIYISGFLIAMTWQFLFRRKRIFKDKFYVSLYSWLFIF